MDKSDLVDPLTVCTRRQFERERSERERIAAIVADTLQRLLPELLTPENPKCR